MGKRDTALPARILRFPEVNKRVGYCRMHVDRLEKAGKFPQRVQIGPNSVGWVESDIDRWIAEKIAARDARPPVSQTLGGSDGTP